MKKINKLIINTKKVMAIVSSSFILLSVGACSIKNTKEQNNEPFTTSQDNNIKEQFLNENSDLMYYLEMNPNYFEENASLNYNDEGELISFCIEIPITENETKTYVIGKNYFEFFNIPEINLTLKK